MPKFKKTCGNPFHKDWTDDTAKHSILGNFKSEGLVELGNGLKSKKEGASGDKLYRGVENVCRSCWRKFQNQKSLLNSYLKRID